LSWGSGNVLVRSAKKMIGDDDGSTFRKLGGSMSCGSWRWAWEMAACTSCAAASMSRLSANCIEIEVPPWLLLEVIVSMPGMVENCFSSGVATELAIVSGLAPARLALTEMVG
jgi:hypothetical protein